MKLPGWKTLRQTGRWLRSRLSGGALILGYHRIDAPASDPFEMCVAPAHFAQQLAVLRRVAHPLSLADALQRMQQNTLPRRAVVVTFDDGYLDNLTNALPLLAAQDIPAAVFITTGSLGGTFWWDELTALVERLNPLPQSIALRAGAAQFEWHPAADASDRARLLNGLYRWLLALGEDERRAALAQLNDRANTSGSRLLMTREEVAALAANRLIDIGAHTVSHPLLSRLPAEEQRREIHESKRALESLIGSTIAGFSYPNGDYSAVTRAAVRDAGFAFACTSRTDVALPASDRWTLPRFWIPDWDGERFARWLSRWLPG